MLRKRLPSKREILLVFAATVFPVYSWAMLRLFYILPSWLKFLSPGEIITTSMYIFPGALLESAIILAGLLFIAFILPPKYFRNQFVAQGSLLVWLYAAWSAFLIDHITLAFDWSLREIAVYASIFLAIVIASTVLLCFLAVYRFKALNRLIVTIVERLTIFLYLYIPLSLIGLAVVIVRNL